MFDIILGALLLPFRVYFRPQAYHQRFIDALSFDDLPDPTLWQIYKISSGDERREKLRFIGNEFAKLYIAYLWFPIVFGIMKVFLPEIQLPEAELGLAMLGLIAIIPPIIMIQRSVYWSFAGGWVFLFGLGIGVMIHILLLGKYAFATYGVINPDTIAKTVDSHQAIQAIMVLGIIMGLSARIFFLGSSKFAYPIYSIGIVLTAGLIIVSPFIAKSDAVAQSNPYWINAAAIMFSGVWLYPFSFVLSLIMAIMPPLSSKVWRLSPAYWDEFYLLPVPCLKAILSNLKKRQPSIARLAIAEIKRNPVHQFFLGDLTQADDFERFMGIQE